MSYPRRGMHGEVVEDLGRRIVSGDPAPSGHLDPVELGRRYQVSHTVVREALKTLAAKGLVDARPKRGTFVRPRGDWSLLDPDVLRWQFTQRGGSDLLRDLAEVRAVVEPAGARLAAARRTAEDVAALEAAFERMAATVADPPAHTEADVAFHRVVLAASGNELLESLEVVIAAALRARDRLIRSHGEPPGFAATHQAVLDAVRQGDPDAAEDAMRDLLAQAERDEAGLLDG
ncbi:FadR/GntR family transcriptional regulator [Nonomuraea jiangxiensis]|uniref:DNA-binding transcriptional regulator, FadR family n=1 Tax=Nonomuraea jiangxiensis TaxID=633440 RepID=A0A1G9M6L5_9ACTN|nr:FadR/GntR family transcriptional regulator [Nonomuraea jiangxiensis]SDL69848.1 DNA-binding transcriptional regulator, FadR family [Nonomuraea jiangxiensis]